MARLPASLALELVEQHKAVLGEIQRQRCMWELAMTVLSLAQEPGELVRQLRQSLLPAEQAEAEREALNTEAEAQLAKAGALSPIRRGG